MKLDWRKLYFGKVSPQEVQEAVHDAEWQRLREALKGTSLSTKYLALCVYYEDQFHRTNNPKKLRMAQVRVTNYVTALSRGGLIKPSDYR